jgi:hypothetical protein
MTHPEKYARPGIYLDEDDHGRLLDENREAYQRDRVERLRRELRDAEARLEAMR